MLKNIQVKRPYFPERYEPRSVDITSSDLLSLLEDCDRALLVFSHACTTFEDVSPEVRLEAIRKNCKLRQIIADTRRAIEDERISCRPIAY